MADGYHTGNMPDYKRTILMKIGAALRAMYDGELPQALPHRLFTLLIDLNRPPEAKEGESDTPLATDDAG